MAMGITFKDNEQDLQLMTNIFVGLGKPAISMNHYDLFEAVKREYPMFTPNKWKDFLSDGRVDQYIQDEFDAIKSAELRKIITDINNSKSVGQAQIINSLTKMLEGDDKKHAGPAFVYCYVPLTEAQAQAENVRILPRDPFIIEG